MGNSATKPSGVTGLASEAGVGALVPVSEKPSGEWSAHDHARDGANCRRWSTNMGRSTVPRNWKAREDQVLAVAVEIEGEQPGLQGCRVPKRRRGTPSCGWRDRPVLRQLLRAASCPAAREDPTSAGYGSAKDSAVFLRGGRRCTSDLDGLRLRPVGQRH